MKRVDLSLLLVSAHAALSPFRRVRNTDRAGRRDGVAVDVRPLACVEIFGQCLQRDVAMGMGRGPHRTKSMSAHLWMRGCVQSSSLIRPLLSAFDLVVLLSVPKICRQHLPLKNMLRNDGCNPQWRGEAALLRPVTGGNAWCGNTCIGGPSRLAFAASVSCKMHESAPLRVHMFCGSAGRLANRSASLARPHPAPTLRPLVALPCHPRAAVWQLLRLQFCHCPTVPHRDLPGVQQRRAQLVPLRG